LRFDVVTAASAEAGLWAAREERPDLITLDLIMPEMTGWEALKEFKEASDLQDIPVVIVSVLAGDHDRGNIFGAVDLLTKPIERDELIKVLRRNLREPRGRTVLVVEDEAGTQELFKNHLEEAGLQVTLAGNGEEAERALERQAPDLILLDLVMPVMDGTAFLQRLREDPARAEIPIIICTGKDLSVEDRKRLLSQATEILAKGDDLQAHLMAALAKQFPLDPRPAPPRRVKEEGGTLAKTAGPEKAVTILVAEDDPLAAAILLHQLEKEGFHVLHYPDGAQALKGALSNPVGLAILDVKMPEMDGFELLERLRKVPAYYDVPIMMLTSMGKEEDIARGLELGADDYLVKPSSPVEVLARVRRLLSQ
ncbi:MAG: response regulator, partial [Longimicrobiales bacterium]|nr:response regulator [Longimicrobiales bacterium]